MRLSLNLLFVLLISLTACKKENNSSTLNNDTPIEIQFIKEGELSLINNDSILKKIDIEIADTNNKKAIGLMNRSSMEENQGMLFVFENDNTSGFYMKDTRIPLDIIFIDKDSTAITVSTREAFDETPKGASRPYRYVLEINAGLAEKWGIEEGVTKIYWAKNK